MIGIDVVDVDRFRAALQRSPGLKQRLFTEAEIRRCEVKGDPVRSLAGTLAAKEAVIKALRLGSLAAWARRIEVTSEPDGAPVARIEGDRRLWVSISHDGSVAVAAALAPNAS